MDKIRKKVGEYYSQKIMQYGVSPEGVDWNSLESQEIRFKTLLDRLPVNNDDVICDFGCGYGALFDYMKANNMNAGYIGYDISDQMLEEARKQHGTEEMVWTNNEDDLINTKVDFVVASGLFNVRLDEPDEGWLQYILSTLDKFNEIASKGFAFNMLTKYSDKPFMRDYLYYADPELIFRHCKENYAKYVAVLHDYPLYEFTIVVKKEL